MRDRDMSFLTFSRKSNFKQLLFKDFFQIPISFRITYKPQTQDIS